MKYEKQLKAVKIVAEPSDECIYKTYVIQNSNANEIKVACHLEYDEDGQAHIRTRRLVDWRE